jgi:hypothetical protein
VLSFPAFPLTPGGMPGPMLGDIILARETIEREAGELASRLMSTSRISSCTDFFIFSAMITLKTRCGKNGSDRDSHFDFA